MVTVIQNYRTNLQQTAASRSQAMQTFKKSLVEKELMLHIHKLLLWHTYIYWSNHLCTNAIQCACVEIWQLIAPKLLEMSMWSGVWAVYFLNHVPKCLTPRRWWKLDLQGSPYFQGGSHEKPCKHSATNITNRCCKRVHMAYAFALPQSWMTLNHQTTHFVAFT